MQLIRKVIISSGKKYNQAEPAVILYVYYTINIGNIMSQ